jgi:hypothetical protein
VFAVLDEGALSYILLYKLMHNAEETVSDKIALRFVAVLRVRCDKYR